MLYSFASLFFQHIFFISPNPVFISILEIFLYFDALKQSVSDSFLRSSAIGDILFGVSLGSKEHHGPLDYQQLLSSAQDDVDNWQRWRRLLHHVPFSLIFIVVIVFFFLLVQGWKGHPSSCHWER